MTTNVRNVLALQDVIGVEIDGKFGPRSTAMLKEIQAKHSLVADGYAGPKTYQAMKSLYENAENRDIDPDTFFKETKARLFKTFNSQQVAGLNAFLGLYKEHKKDIMIAEFAYMLATAFHETARTMQPIEEYGKGRKYTYGKRIKMNRTGYSDTNEIFYGRGYVQLTWYENYDRMGKLLGINMLQNASLALNPDVAANVMLIGMRDGLFTGRKLSHYYDMYTADHVNARRIINGMDKAGMIANYAMQFEIAIRKAMRVNTTLV